MPLTWHCPPLPPPSSRAGDWVPADMALSEANRLDPHHEAVWAYLGLLALKQDRLEEAQQVGGGLVPCCTRPKRGGGCLGASSRTAWGRHSRWGAAGWSALQVGWRATGCSPAAECLGGRQG